MTVKPAEIIADSLDRGKPTAEGILDALKWYGFVVMPRKDMDIASEIITSTERHAADLRAIFKKTRDEK